MKISHNTLSEKQKIWVAAVPVAVLLSALSLIAIFAGADAVNSFGMYALLGSGIVALVLARTIFGVRTLRLRAGMSRSARQMLPCMPLLVFIATVSATWMLGGVVPYLVHAGVSAISPPVFLVVTCFSCAVASTLTGSSWTTIATVGVAFLSIGSAFGYNPALSAGAIISGAYFGDKFSPLSDTTVIASATAGVNVFSLIRKMLATTIPPFALALILFGAFGITHSTGHVDADNIPGFGAEYNLTPWVLLVPCVTLTAIALRLHTLVVLALSSAAGIVSMFVFQPGVVASLGIHDVGSGFTATGAELADSVIGMIPTMLLVLSAMIFGGAMMGSGFLETLTRPVARKLAQRHAVVGATVATGITFNALTADQYVSIIISGNVFKGVYRQSGLSPILLGRTVQDSVPVTSVLVPWNSCGVTQSTVLGVATLAYAPFCFFNLLSPLWSVCLAWYVGRRETRRALAAA